MKEPELIEGAVSLDERGTVTFINDFDPGATRRFYIVRNHRAGFVRAWHGHRLEEKYVTAISGAALVCCVAIDDWANPSPDATVHKFVIGADKPVILAIPAGFANGFMSLTSDAALMFFSTSTVEDSLADDYRYPARYWDPWVVEER